MQELISNIANNAGVNEEGASGIVQTFFNLISKAVPLEDLQALIDQIPGASEFLNLDELLSNQGEAANENEEGGLMAAVGGLLGGDKSGALGGIMSSLGGGMGAIGALAELKSQGLSNDQIQTSAQEIISFAKENAGEELVNNIVAKVPGLNNFV